MNEGDSGSVGRLAGRRLALGVTGSIAAYKAVEVARTATERRLQRALLQFFKPENYADVRRALEQAGRTDLIGSGPGCLIPPHPPKTSAKRGKKRARSGARGVSQLAVNGVSPVTGSSTGKMPLPPGRGYRPHRTSAKRRPRG